MFRNFYQDILKNKEYQGRDKDNTLYTEVNKQQNMQKWRVQIQVCFQIKNPIAFLFQLLLDCCQRTIFLCQVKKKLRGYVTVP